MDKEKKRKEKRTFLKDPQHGQEQAKNNDEAGDRAL
jgi:hypothetical protein